MDLTLTGTSPDGASIALDVVYTPPLPIGPQLNEDSGFDRSSEWINNGTGFSVHDGAAYGNGNGNIQHYFPGNATMSGKFLVMTRIISGGTTGEVKARVGSSLAASGRTEPGVHFDMVEATGASTFGIHASDPDNDRIVTELKVWQISD